MAHLLSAVYNEVVAEPDDEMLLSVLLGVLEGLDERQGEVAGRELPHLASLLAFPLEGDRDRASDLRTIAGEEGLESEEEMKRSIHFETEGTRVESRRTLRMRWVVLVAFSLSGRGLITDSLPEVLLPREDPKTRYEGG